MTANYLHDDGTLRLARWAKPDADRMALSAASVAMYGTKAMAAPLVTNGQLGVDLVRVPAGGGFAPHTHPGDHLLIVVEGRGTITYDGRIYPTEAGQVYLIEGAIPHAVGAITDHSILAVGSPHRAADSPDRMSLTDYLAVATDLGTITCLVCNQEGSPSDLLAFGCVHAPQPTTIAKPVVLGLARARGSEGPFAGTPSGAALASMLYVEPEHLDKAIEPMTLTDETIEHWDSVPMGVWQEFARERLPYLTGRLIVVCGAVVANAVASAFGTFPVRPFSVEWYPMGTLVAAIPHPVTMQVVGTEDWERSQTLLTRACAIAAAGPIVGQGFGIDDAVKMRQ